MCESQGWLKANHNRSVLSLAGDMGTNGRYMDCLPTLQIAELKGDISSELASQWQHHLPLGYYTKL